MSVTAKQHKAEAKLILTIDDEDDLLKILRIGLEDEGYRVACARNGVEALAFIQNNKPDLIICDRAMPTMSGYEFITHMRSIYPEMNDVPFIFLTGLVDPRDKNAVRPFHPTAYIEKPVDMDALIKQLETNTFSS